MIDSQGNEHLDRVNNIKYNDKPSCLVDRAIMSNDSVIDSDDTHIKSITYFVLIACFIKLSSLYWINIQTEHQKGRNMKTLVIGNIEFNIELIVGSPTGQLIIMHSAKCIQTGRVYNKKKANEYYRLYSA